MERQLLDKQEEQVRQIASVWLQQSEQHLLASEYKQARSLLNRIWVLTYEQHTDLASSVAWRLAWMLLRQEEFAEAAEWFGRIESIQALDRQLWPIERATQVALCQALADHAIRLEISSQSPAPSAVVHVCSFGRFRIFQNNSEVVKCRSRKAIQLLRYLLTRDSWQARRDELVDMLWPQEPYERAIHSLHVVVNLLRRHINDHNHTYVKSTQQSYAINASASFVDDGNSFRHSCHQADANWRSNNLSLAERMYREAITLYTGDYFIDDSDMHWQVIEQQQLLSYYLVALERLGLLYFQQGRHSEALEPFRRLIARDSYREDIHRALMACYQQLGRRNDALCQYRFCVATLNHDLGIKPLAETTALYDAIVGNA